MLTNERLRRLIDTDRQAVIELCAAFDKPGLYQAIWNDPDVAELRTEVAQHHRPPQGTLPVTYQPRKD